MAEGATGATTLEEFAAKLVTPRVAWVMVPAGITGADRRRARRACSSPATSSSTAATRTTATTSTGPTRCAPKGIHYVDIGTSGGVFGLERGFCLMIGGDTTRSQHLDPLLKTIAPGLGAVERTPGATGDPSTAEQGYLHCGPNGAGHFVKMVHNGIEYGIMAAYAEGLNVLHRANVGNETGEVVGRDGAAARSRATTSTTSTPRPWPRCGGAAAWSPPGCST